MTVNLNHAIVQGMVVSVIENDNNTKVTIVTNDDYKKGDEWIQRGYFIPVTYFGAQAEHIARLVQKGSQVTLEFKVASFKPKDSEYHVPTFNGISFHLTPGANQTQDAPKKSNNNKRKAAPPQFDEDEDDDDTWPDLPPWGKD